MHQVVPAADASFEDLRVRGVDSPDEEEHPWGSAVDGFIPMALPAGPRSLPPSVGRLERWRRAGATAALPQVQASVSVDRRYEQWWADSVAKAAGSGVAEPASGAAAAAAVRDHPSWDDDRAAGPGWQAPCQSGPWRNRPASPARWTGSSSSAAAARPPPWRPAEAAQAAAATPKRLACGQGSWAACLHSESGPFQRNDSLFSFFGSRGRVP